MIWYQGESNLNTRKLYPQLQQTLIEQWRGLWRSGDMPFYFVQLAPRYAPQDGTTESSHFAEMREAQAMSLSLPHTGMVVTAIAVKKRTCIRAINKPSALSLAALALAKTYQKSSLAHGPVFQKQEIRQSEIVLPFRFGQWRIEKSGRGFGAFCHRWG